MSGFVRDVLVFQSFVNSQNLTQVRCKKRTRWTWENVNQICTELLEGDHTHSPHINVQHRARTAVCLVVPMLLWFALFAEQCNAASQRMPGAARRSHLVISHRKTSLHVRACRNAHSRNVLQCCAVSLYDVSTQTTRYISPKKSFFKRLQVLEPAQKKRCFGMVKN